MRVTGQRERSARPGGYVLLASGVVCAFAGCSRVSLPSIEDVKIPGVYRLAIQQGNVLDTEALSKLEPGLTKRKVSFLIGTPAVQDVFNQDRWDYVYTYEPGGGDREQRIVSLQFSGDVLQRIEGDIALVHANGSSKNDERVVVVPPSARKRSLLNTINPWADEPSRPAVTETIADGRGRSDARPIISKADTTVSVPATESSSEADTGQGPNATDRGEDENESVSAGDDTKSLFERLAERFSFPDGGPSGPPEGDR